MKADDVNIQAVFNRSRHLEIPFFQRAYVWGKEGDDLWDRFLEDIKNSSNSNEKYFMGVIILKQRGTDIADKIGDVRVVIDGQQRLTTLILLFKALYGINETPEKFKENFYTNYGDLILRHNRMDKNVFEDILNDKELDPIEKESYIYKCYEYFKNKIVKDEIDPNKILQNIIFVSVELGEKEDEQQIFDSINSLGISLTTAELLKNHLFKRNEESYKKNWELIFESNDEKGYWDMKITSGRNIRTNLDLFLESYLTIKIQDKKFKIGSQDKKSLLKIRSVFDSYKKLIEKHNLEEDELINELKEYALIYKKNIIPTITREDISKNNFNKRLNLVIFGLDTTTIIPYILYISKNVKSNEEKGKIFRYLESYLMRRIISRLTTKNYNQLFRESLINNKIDSLDKLKEFIEKKSDKINYMPSDDEVKRGFDESKLSNKQTRGILYLIETAIRNNDMHPTALKFLNEYSLEHLLPKKWRNNWDKEKLLTEDQKIRRDTILLTLGNLTLITKQLNSSIRDSNWEKKKAGIGKHKGLNEYSRGIDTFGTKYIEKENWDEKAIQERAKELSESAINTIWSFE